MYLFQKRRKTKSKHTIHCSLSKFLQWVWLSQADTESRELTLALWVSHIDRKDPTTLVIITASWGTHYQEAGIRTRAKT